jgi:hypothetical protein
MRMKQVLSISVVVGELTGDVISGLGHITSRIT